MDMIILVVLLASVIQITAGVSDVYNVKDYGAVGDGKADDTEAFRKAWEATCGAPDQGSKMLIPEGGTYYVKPIQFKGPCKSNNVIVWMVGTVVAPEDPQEWKGIEPTQWLEFNSVNGLTVSGSEKLAGVVNGRGSNWWKKSCRLNPGQGCAKSAPTAIRFIGCNDVSVHDLKSVDSPQTHFLFMNTERVHAYKLDIKAPGDSPNTDGIHIHASKHVQIYNSSIGSGDDCVSLGDVYNVTVTNIKCGPGHGISVGSLGNGGQNASVEFVSVDRVNFYNTTNGVRIKSWQGGQGYAKSIYFQNIKFTHVQNPIIIDQYYFCDVKKGCKDQPKAVSVSDVWYAHIEGTSQTPTAVSLKCSRAVGCTDLHFNNVNIHSSDGKLEAKSECINAHGNTEGIIRPELSCLLS